DPGTLLLSYAVGHEKTYVFAVTPAATGSPGNGLTVYTVPIGERELRESVDAFRRLVARTTTGPELASSSRALYDALLAPAETLLAGSDRVLILPDGPLHRLPWSALSRIGPGASRQYVAEWKPVFTSLSATVHAELQKMRRASPRDPSVTLAAFGDPRYPPLTRSRTAALRGEAETHPEGSREDAGIDGIADPQLR